VSEESDNKDKKTEANESPAASPPEPKAASWNPAAEPPPKPAAASGVKASAKRGSSAIAWLALILIIGLCVAAAWSVREAQRREVVLNQRLASLESAGSDSGQQRGELDKLGQQLQGRLKAGLSKADAAVAAQAAQIERLEASLLVQRDEIARFGATDRKDWLLAEAEYLLRLANQRLIMAGDVVAATALLRSADNILLELDDATLHEARGAVAADLAALRAVPRVDVEGLYLRLAALAEQVDALTIFELPDISETVEPAVAEDWQARLQQGYHQALKKLSDYIVVRRRDVPYEALMDPQWERLVRQNMRMLLEQAQVALLSGNQLLFQESLERAGHWVGQFFEIDERGAQALAGEIASLSDKTIAVDIPDVSRSLKKLDEAMEHRLQLEDGQ
jgi:uroporphyrin-3 C-methyltransferase